MLIAKPFIAHIVGCAIRLTVSVLGSTHVSLAQENSVNACAPAELTKLFHADSALKYDDSHFVVLASLGGQAKCQFRIELNSCVNDTLSRTSAYGEFNDVSRTSKDIWLKTQQLVAGLEATTISYVVTDKRDGRAPTISKITSPYGKPLSADQVDLSGIEQLCQMADLSDDAFIAQMNESDQQNRMEEAAAAERQKQIDEARAVQEAKNRAAADAEARMSEEQSRILSPQAVSNQIKSCFSPPPEAVDAGLSVTIVFTLNAEGIVDGEPEVSSPLSTELERALGRAAIRAITSCGPYYVGAKPVDIEMRFFASE